MRPTEKLAVFAACGLAVVASLSAHLAGSPAIASERGQQAAFKFGTVDPYIITEALMQGEELKGAREKLGQQYDTRAREYERKFQELSEAVQVLPQSDPKVQEIIKQAQEKEREWQGVQAQRQQEMEKLSSGQLIDSYTKVLAAVNAVADRGGYTHVLAARDPARKIESTTVASALQEFLARPMVKGPKGDDLTDQVMAELKLPPLPAPKDAAPAK